MSIVDTRVFCDACGDRLVGLFEELSHKRDGHCRGYSHAQVNAMTDADKSALVGLIYMAWAIGFRSTPAPRIEQEKKA